MHRSEDNIKTVLNIGCEDMYWIEVAQYWLPTIFVLLL